MTKAERKNLPDPHHAYERADPKAESGMGDLDRHNSTPTNSPDGHQHANGHRPGGKPPTPPVDPGQAGATLPEVAPIDEVEAGPGVPPGGRSIDGPLSTEPPLDHDLRPTGNAMRHRKRPASTKDGASKEAAHKHDDKV
ncbi:MAG TPA: hypothetical protein PLD59_13955 [Tepidisphaeraceae bacterium]|nr:hypothetical protein [Tepidisphaeraceae bacterium]